MDREKLQGLFTTQVLDRMPQKLKATAILRAFGLWKIPLLFSVRPSVVELTDTRAVVRIRLSRWTRNHWGSMYFGTLAIGADCTVGLVAMHHIWKSGHKNLQLLFKDFHADFLRRPDGHVLFICEEGEKAQQLVEKAAHTGERQNLTLHAHAVVEGKESEPVAKFTLTLSLKKKS